MKLHLTPTLFLKGKHQISFNRFKIDALNLDLTNDDLKTNRPYPNPNYIVGHHANEEGTPAGLFIDTQQFPREFESKSSWIVDGTEILHIVRYEVIDAEFDVVSDQMIYWQAFKDEANKLYQSRIPTRYRDKTPLEIQPKMEYQSPVFAQFSNDTFNDTNYIIMRVNTMSLPTLERERFTSFHSSRRILFPKKLLTGY